MTMPDSAAPAPDARAPASAPAPDARTGEPGSPSEPDARARERTNAEPQPAPQATEAPPIAAAQPARAPAQPAPPPYHPLLPYDADILLPFAWKVHDYTSELIRFADTKASVVLALSSAILGTLFGTRMNRLLAGLWQTAGGPGPWQVGLAVLALVALALLVLAVAAAATAVVPRLGKSGTPSLIFWQSILQHGEPAAYVARLLTHNHARLLQQVVEEIFVLAAICRDKYRHVRWSIWLAAAGSLLGGMAILLSS